MPTYEYACSACGHEWEQAQRITEAPIEVCPKCAATAAHRLISGGTNFILKGGGWYSDLYASPKGASKKPEGGSSEGKSESKTSESSDSKPSGSSGDKGATKDTSSSTGSSSTSSSTPTPAPSST